MKNWPNSRNNSQAPRALRGLQAVAGGRSGATRTALALGLVFLLGGMALFHASAGFRVVSTEDARRLDIAEHPRQIPDVAIFDASGLRLSLARALREDGRVAIVSFIYTRCNAICSVLGTEFQQMQRSLQQRGLERQLRLFNISFDAADGPSQLSAYAGRMQADPRRWSFAGVESAPQRQMLLDGFGIAVIPAPLGEFQHNAAFHIVTPDGRLARIFDYEQPDAALEYALSLSQQYARIARHVQAPTREAAL